MSRQITIRTGSRLHFGLLAHAAKDQRLFGGVGLMIDSPGYEVAVAAAEQFSFSGPAELRRRVEQCVATYQSTRPEQLQSLQVRVEVRRAIPAHIGLGSGTQLGMALAQGLALLAGDGAADCLTLAHRVGRGERSAVGVHGFGRGGLIVDGGKAEPDGVGTLICRLEFPAEWRFLLITPRGTTGISGPVERDALQRLPPIAAQETDRLCGILIRKLLPAVVEADFEGCAGALCEYGCLVGARYAPLQGGIFASRQMEELAAHLQRECLCGVGQTSWGPTIFALCPTAAAAESLRARLSGDVRTAGCDLRVAAPLNTGATVEVSESGKDSAAG